MAPSQEMRPTRLLALFAVLVAVVYALVFFTGDRSPTAKLGIDLQGGTRVTLTARTPDGSKPSQDSLRRAQEIIETRVNGLGVSGSEVVIDGDNLVITVPGDNSSQARSLGQTARLYIRPVLSSQPAGQAAQAPAQPAPAQPPAATPPPGETQAPAGTPAPAAPAPQSRPFPAQEPTTPPPTVENRAPESGGNNSDVNTAEQTASEISAAKATRQSTDPAVQQQAMAAMDCNAQDPLQGNDDPTLPLVACSVDGNYVYLLAPSIIDGQDIADASSSYNTQQARHEVSLTFKSDASETWAEFTSQNIGKQAAFVLDTKVVSAPVVQGATPAGSATSITGSFTSSEARELANTLKYGSLPLSFSASEAETVSATLGLASLNAGLLAGLIGLIAVLIYSLAYYRLLGVIVAWSLFCSGIVVYGILVLLGRWINFTLDLAGIAGLIIGIGMTADSFVVFFERIKDEMREGRSFRSAVPRGWARARRTILSGNAVSFIAAAVLYALAVGQVRGFAFTLGLTTILDVVVVFLVTAPIVTIASRSHFWSKPSVNGLGAIQQVARERKQAAVLAGREA